MKAKDLYESQEDLKVVIDNRTKNYDINNKGTDIVNAIPCNLQLNKLKFMKLLLNKGLKLNLPNGTNIIEK